MSLGTNVNSVERDGQSIKCEMRRKPITVGEALDERIARIRKELEHTCIVKAKAEAAQMLDKPMDFMMQLAGYPY